MITLREAARGLLDAVESAIESGDWKVDGACDPTVEIIRLKNALAKPKEEWVGLTDDEIIKCFDSVAFGQVEDDLIINKHVNIFRAIHYIEAKLKEKNNG